MKRLEGAVSSCGTAELEVIECDCGYHMGIDASFVTQVDDAFFDVEVHCPNCQTKIDVRDILDMEPLTVKIEVSRTCTAYRDVEVAANSLAAAKYIAMEEAGNYEFSEKDADYETTDGWCMNDDL
jgi:hypothetical protein